MDELNALKILTSIAGFLPWILQLISVVCALIGLIYIASGLAELRRVNDAQSQRTAGSCFIQMAMGAGFIAMTSIVAVLGMATTGMAPANALDLLYEAESKNNFQMIAAATIFSLIQASGLVAMYVGWGKILRLSANTLRPGEQTTWPSALTFFLGGLACVFIYWSIAFVGAVTGIPFAKWLNNML